MLIPIKYNTRYLRFRWGSTILTALTFALVVAVFIIVSALGLGMADAFVSTGHPLNLLIMRPGVQSEMQSQVSIERYQVIRTLPGIAKNDAGEPLVAPELLAIVNKPKKANGQTTNLQIRGVHPNSFAIRPGVEIVEGRMFRTGLREAIVSRSVANRFEGMELGDAPHLGNAGFTIVGIFDAKGTAYDSEIWLDYQELGEEFNRQGAYSTVVVRAVDRAAAESLAVAVDEDNRLKLTATNEVEYYANQVQSAGAIIALGGFLSVFMAVGACFAGMNAMYGTVANRVGEIGTLRVLGFSPFSILICFLLESIVLSLIGGVVGCLISLPMNGLAVGTTNFLTFSEVLFSFSITPSLMGLGMGFAVIMGIVGGFLPAVAAARYPIIDTLKEA